MPKLPPPLPPKLSLFARLGAVRSILIRHILSREAAWSRRVHETFRTPVPNMSFVDEFGAHVLRVDGKTAADVYAERRGRKLTAEERTVIHAQARAYCTLIRVEALADQTVDVTDLLTGETVTLITAPVLASFDVGNVMLVRVIELDGERGVATPYPLSLPPDRAANVLAHLIRRFGEPPVHVDVLRTEAATIAILRRWEDELHTDAPRPATHERFTFLEEDRPHVESVLTHLPGSLGPTLEPHDHHRYAIVGPPTAPLGSLLVGPHTIDLTATTPQHAHLLAGMLLATLPEVRRVG